MNSNSIKIHFVDLIHPINCITAKINMFKNSKVKEMNHNKDLM